MKNKLLLTTALVAFAIPAWAELGVPDWEASAEDISKLTIVSNKNVKSETGKANYTTIYVKVKGQNTSGEFTSNEADSGGAFAIGKSGGDLTITDGNFKLNEAYFDGGAIANYGKLSVVSSIFENNIAQTNIKDGNNVDIEPIGGGAIAMGIAGRLDVSETLFKNNTSNFNGGALATRRTLQAGEANFVAPNHYINIEDSVFENNKALGNTVIKVGTIEEIGGNGGAISNYFQTATVVRTTFKNNSADNSGGAIHNAALYDVSTKEKNNATGNITIEYSKFENNTAKTSGGAIYNEKGGTVILAKENIFSGNNVNGIANDIHNDGELKISGNLTLDGGITGSGSITFENANLTAKLGGTTIYANSITIANSTLNLILGDELKEEYSFISLADEAADAISGEFKINNALYKITYLETGKIKVENKSMAEIEDSLGVNKTEASVLQSLVSNSSNNQNFNEVAKVLGEAAQLGNKDVVKEVAKLGADAAPVVASQERGSVDMLFNVVSGELNGDTSSLGRSSGDAFKKVTAWVRGLFNKADHEATSKSAGFNADTYGVAFGLDKEVNNNTRLGVGYAYSQTDVEASGRNTDIDTNTLFMYAKYQPAKWYINSMLGYSWSAYKEAKTVAGYDAGAKYDVDTIALQSMYGYEGNIANHNVTPEFGFRYLRVEKDSYTDRLGTTITSSSEDILTAVLATKIAKDYRSDDGTIIRPELRVAVTYDVMEADNIANVVLANGASYSVNGEKQNRLGFELGAKVTTYAADNFEFSAGAQTNFREDYQDYSFTLDAKYNF